MGSRRGASLHKSGTPGIVRIKADSSITKTARQRRRTTGGAYTKSTVSTGISSTKTENSMIGTSGSLQRTTGKSDMSSSGKDWQPLPPSTVQGSCPQIQVLGGIDHLEMATEMPACELRQTSQPFMKLKLQLFPIDEATRKGLEKEEHNPHLELTLRAQKKISSVLKHLNSKWGSSNIASGELMLIPYNIQQENLANHRRWTLKDADISASDVYASIGSPAVFRLRYGWFSNLETENSQVPLISPFLEDHPQSEDIQKDHAHPKIICGDEQPCPDCMPASTSDPLNATVARPIQMDQEDNLRTDNSTALLSGSWTDNLTNASFRDLFMQASITEDANRCDPISVERDSLPQQIPFSCDSFDAAIAAVISSRQGSGPSMMTASHTSIWDAEETCHAFPIQNITPSSMKEGPSSSKDAAASFRACSQNLVLDSMRSPDLVEVNPQVELTQDGLACQEEQAAQSQIHVQGLDSVEPDFGMTGICWSDSLGPFDFGISSSKQIISGDSISLSGLIANSLDAFQNGSFFGKDPKVAHEAQEAPTAMID
ncbi:TSL-kinase interacting protein 1-like isoform X2 [Magnolia sinica]|uniref:TSL-kinase interacting protein 1-like isoform X2 n=1 Tax=Magnolia sinica TaxID=86752 RepID=UPI00265B18D6|nr:TSL-kinase interacting protein 1-like isoform X2 [Magnolia sinica]